MRKTLNSVLVSMFWLALVFSVAGCGRETPVRTVFTVEGMHCDGCSSAITDALTETDGVEKASADHEEGVAEAVYRSGTVDAEALKAEIENWRWAGVPFYLRTGKRMNHRASEIIIQFKSVPHLLFKDQAGVIQNNRLVIRLQPDESIKLSLMIKVPGSGMVLKRENLNLNLAEREQRSPLAYERLLLDVIRGNATLFMHRTEVEGAWRWIESILRSWAERGEPPVGPVVLFSVEATAPGAFWANFTFTQGHTAFHANRDDPRQLGLIDGRLRSAPDDDLGAGAQQCPGHHRTDNAGTAGYNRCFSFKTENIVQIRHKASPIFRCFKLITRHLFSPRKAENACRNVSRQIRYKHLRFLEVFRKTVAAAGSH